jgi:hypothetical protein
VEEEEEEEEEEEVVVEGLNRASITARFFQSSATILVREELMGVIGCDVSVSEVEQNVARGVPNFSL